MGRINKENKILFEKGLRRCTKCNHIKSLSKFNKQKIGYKGFHSQCKECINDYDKKYQEKTNKRKKRDKQLKAKEYRKNYKKQNKQKINQQIKEWKKKKKQEDPFYKLKCNLSTRLSTIISKSQFSLNTKELIGCGKEDFLNYIESQFKEGMNWDNYGKKGWHLDHKIPFDNFDLSNKKEIEKVCHYTNLQPLWWFENLQKGPKLNTEWN